VGAMTLMLSPRTVSWLLAIMALISPPWCWLVMLVGMVILPIEVRLRERTPPATPARRGAQTVP
jgi:hypothetical protein